jgi:hypothetical protein
MPGNLPAQSHQIHSSQQSQGNAFPSKQELNNNWTKVSYRRGRSTQDETETKTKESKDWLKQFPIPVTTQLY